MLYDSVEDFATELADDDRSSFTFEEADELAIELRVTTAKIIRELREYGFTYEGRPKERRVRGFTSNPHDRWYGPGSSRTHGGSGWEQINGFNERSG
jgi:hypothetical protein